MIRSLLGQREHRDACKNLDNKKEGCIYFSIHLWEILYVSLHGKTNVNIRESQREFEIKVKIFQDTSEKDNNKKKDEEHVDGENRFKEGESIKSDKILMNTRRSNLMTSF